MTQLLSVSYTNRGGATQVQVYRNNDGSLTAFGNPYTPTGLDSDSANNGSVNLAIQYGNYFYCSAGRDLRRFNPSTGNWDVDVAPYSAGASGPLLIGKGPTGNLRLAVMYRLNTAAAAVRTLDTPGGVWNAELTGGVTNTVPVQGGIVYNNRGYVTIGGHAFEFDFVSNNRATFNVNGAAVTNLAFTRAKNRFFVLQNTGGGNEWTDIYELIAGSFLRILDGSVNGAMPRKSVFADPSCPNWHALHYDDASDSLIVHAWQQSAAAGAINPGGSGWYVVQVPLTTLTEANITATVVPGALAAPTGPSPAGDVRFAIEVDADTNPLSPITYVWVSYADGAWARFRWNGVGSPMTSLGSGGNRGLALSENKLGGGEYLYDGSTTANPSYIVEEVQDRVALPGATTIFLRATQFDETGGSPTPLDQTVGLYWGTTQAQPRTLATITNAQKVSGPGSAPVIVANKITNFTADGTTIYSVDWQAATDGLVNQQRHMLKPHIEF